MTRAGGLEMPASVAGLVAVNEVVVHGWDIARASGQPFECAPNLLGAARQFVQSAVAQNPHGSPGLFWPARAIVGRRIAAGPTDRVDWPRPGLVRWPSARMTGRRATYGRATATSLAARRTCSATACSAFASGDRG